MPRFIFPRAILPLFALGGLLAAGAASAQQAAAQTERCQGILCDFIEGPQGQRPAQQKPGNQAAAPATGIFGTLFSDPAPRAAAPAAPRPVVEGQGGGIVRTLTAAPPEEPCVGVLCDLIDGNLRPEKAAPEAADTASKTDPAPAADATTAQAANDTQPAEALIRSRPEPRCVATARDPWVCAR